MAVFFKDKHGDIWGGESREEIEQEMIKEDTDADISALESVPADHKIIGTDENECATDELVTLAEEFTPGLGAYKVATND